MVRSAVVLVVPPLHGAGVPGKEMITGAEAQQLEEDPLAGGVLAAVEADPSLGTGGGRGPFLGTGTTNPPGLFHALEAAPGQMTENEPLRIKGSRRKRLATPCRFTWTLLLSFLSWVFKQSSILVCSLIFFPHGWDCPGNISPFASFLHSSLSTSICKL